MKTQKHLNNKQQQQNGFKKPTQTNGGNKSSQQHQVEPKSMNYCVEQKYTNGHTMAIDSLAPKDTTITTKCTATMNNKHTGDKNSFPSSSSSFLTQQAYLPKYIEKSFR